MRMTIFTIGTRGDVQPYVALALGLEENGHAVTLASHPSMRTLIESHGVTFVPIGPDVDVGKAAAAIRGRSVNWLLGFIRVMQFTVSIIDEASPDILSLCQDTDLVIVSHSFAGAAEAAKLDKPTVSVTLQHQAIPTPESTRSLFKRATQAAVGRIMGMLMVRPYNRLRRKIGAPLVKDVEEMMSSRLNLLPISPRVVVPDPRWGPQHHLTGYWFLDKPTQWQPPADLEDFLAAGEPPIAMSLGAMSLGEGADTEETVQLLLTTLRRAGVRAVVQGWTETLATLGLPPSIYPAGPMPHGWLFDRVRAIVHHGGFGTTAAALRAGVPSVVIPHIIDQRFWGERIETLRVGPPAIPRAKLSAERLARALKKVTEDQAMQSRAAELGAHIRDEEGVHNAVRLIEHMTAVAPDRKE